MAIANIKAVIDSDIKKVWEVVTSLDKYSWRTDLSKIESLDNGRKFIEHTKDGYQTTFTITVLEPYKRYAFDIENENIEGHWTGIFAGDEHRTTIDFTEDITVKKWLMKPFAGLYLKKQQAAYLRDLKACLENQATGENNK